jgi:hypothetical protein
MRSLPPQVLVLWACSALAQLTALTLLFSRNSFRKLPLFTAYTALNFSQVIYLVIVYSTSGLTTDRTLDLAWYSECVTLFAQGWATAEILKVTLRPYQGIWGLVWRALAGTSIFIVLLVALTTQGDWARAKWFELNRGYHLTFAAAVIACLAVVRYYSIEVPRAYKIILGGFCFYSCTEILLNTVLQPLLKARYSDYEAVWQSVTMLSFLAVEIVWVAALWRPLPVDARQAPPSDSVYQQLSPEINKRLRELNEKLLQLWKMEARPQ